MTFGNEFEGYDESAHRRTLQRGWVKIHEGCGGLVRWVEKYDDPHVGWTGACIHCGREAIVEERIVFVTEPAIPEKTARELALETSASGLADLRYPMEVQEAGGFEAAQRELRDRLKQLLEGSR